MEFMRLYAENDDRDVIEMEMEETSQETEDMILNPLFKILAFIEE